MKPHHRWNSTDIAMHGANPDDWRTVRILDDHMKRHEDEASALDRWAPAWWLPWLILLSIFLFWVPLIVWLL